MKRIAGYAKHPLAAVLIALLVLPYVLTTLGTTVSIATEVIIFALLGLGYNLLLGYTGLMSFGHSAYFGIGAYATGLAQLHLFRGTVIPLVVGTAFGTLVGAIVGSLVLRRRGVYFSLLTLAFAQMFFYLGYRWTEVTGGESGLTGVQRVPLSIGGVFTLDMSTSIAYYYFVAAVVLVGTLAMWRIVRSPFAGVLMAIRQNDERARSVGYNTGRYKLVAFIISACFTSLAGGLYILLLEFMYPEILHVTMSGEIMAMTVVGGFGSFYGPIIGAAFFVFLRDFLTSYTENWLIVFGAVFMAFILFSPQGIVGTVQRLWLALRPKPRDPSTPSPGSAAPLGGGSDDAASDAPAAHATTQMGGETLVCRGVTKRFGALVAVDGVDLVVRQGELHSIIGPNGAGKTTLFNCLTGLLQSDAGGITFEGRDISRLPPYGIAAHSVARSFQIISIFQQLTVFENVRIAAQAGSRHRFSLAGNPDRLADVNQTAREVLGLVGLVGLENTTAANLSHGDQRLLEMAIALATSPRLLMLDEPLAGLSPAERTRTARLIRNLAGEHTIVLIEHDIDRVLELSDRITVMHQGKVIAQGSPEEIQRNQAVQEAYLGHAQLEEVRLAARAPRAKGGDVLLSVDTVNAYYGKSHVLRDVSLQVREGEAVCLLGRNGVGKTTTLSTILGLVPPKSGQIRFKEKRIAGWPPYAIGRLGIGLVPQGRRIFPNLTVVDNLGLGRRADNHAFWNMDQVLTQFPKLAELKGRRGENLSGGELQMLAIARALMGNPHLLLLDEAMEGLAPAIVAEVAHMIQQVRGRTTILLVEQSAPLALALCDRAYVMSRGEIIYAGAATELAEDQALQNRLLGV